MTALVLFIDIVCEYYYYICDSKKPKCQCRVNGIVRSPVITDSLASTDESSSPTTGTKILKVATDLTKTGQLPLFYWYILHKNAFVL